jgi:hypothetical protein
MQFQPVSAPNYELRVTPKLMVIVYSISEVTESP